MTAIGKITGPHGVNGECIFEHYLAEDINVLKWDALVIELFAGSYIPFFIEGGKRINSTAWRLKLEEINSPEEVKQILQKDVYPSPNVTVNPIVKKSMDNLIGFTIINESNPIGKIDNILNPNTNPLFIVFEGQENELLIPANKELINEINHESKEVYMTLPEGLV